MKEKSLENDVIKFWIDNGIVFGEYRPDQFIDLEKAKKTVNTRLQICDGHSYPHVLYISGIKSTNKEARDFFSKDDGIKNMASMALITDSPISRSIGNFFLFLTKPAVPTKMFMNVEEAIKWSKGQVSSVAMA